VNEKTKNNPLGFLFKKKKEVGGGERAQGNTGRVEKEADNLKMMFFLGKGAVHSELGLLTEILQI